MVRRDFRGLASGMLLACLCVVAVNAIGETPSDTCTRLPAELETEFFSEIGPGDVVVFGELHGNEQSPQFFAAAVCSAVALDRKVQAGLELSPAAVQVATDYLSGRRGGGDTDVRAGLSGSPFWMKAKDGRASAANFALIKELVEMQTDIGDVIGFDMRITGREAFGDTAVATITEARAKTEGEANIFLLTGRGHASPAGGPHSLTAALRRAGHRVVVVNEGYAAGQSWVCSFGTCGVQAFSATPECAAHADDGRPAIARLVAKGEDSIAVCLPALTASAPAIGD